MVNDALIEEINAAYRRLSATTEDRASADRELAEYVLRIRLDNVEAILEVKNESCRASTSTACLKLTTIDAWRPTERKLISIISTQGARSSGCT